MFLTSYSQAEINQADVSGKTCNWLEGRQWCWPIQESSPWQQSENPSAEVWIRVSPEAMPARNWPDKAELSKKASTPEHVSIWLKSLWQPDESASWCRAKPLIPISEALKNQIDSRRKVNFNEGGRTILRPQSKTQWMSSLYGNSGNRLLFYP